MVDAERLIKLPKVLFLPLPAFDKAENHNFLQTRADLYDLSGALVPNLQYHYMFKIVGRNCNVKFSLHLINATERRIFQLEIYDRHYPSHRGDNGIVWFGPHMFHKGQARKVTTKLTCAESERERWFKRFCRHTHITVRELPGQYQRELL